MRAMILAAGLGTRLKAITRHIPKPLVDLGPQTKIIDTVVADLLRAGIDAIAVNLHYKGEMIQAYLQEHYPQVDWAFFHEDKLLGTGGGIYNARSFLTQSPHFIVTNSDILYYIDLQRCIEAHQSSGAKASLILFDGGPFPQVACHRDTVLGFLDRDGQPLHGFEGDEDAKRCTFTGIQILHRDILEVMAPFSGDAFSSIQAYGSWLQQGHPIHAVYVDQDYWNDVGTPASLRRGQHDFEVIDFVARGLNEPIHGFKRLFKGASSKSVYRITSSGSPKIVITSEDPSEIKAWSAFSRFFFTRPYPVPQILKAADTWLLMEDGGTHSLLDLVQCETEFPYEHYNQAIEAIHHLNRIPTAEFPIECCTQHPQYNLANVRFDIQYFNRYYFRMRLSPGEISELAATIHAELSRHPLAIMHRDYQSSNILLNYNHEIRIVDIQTMRLGYGAYDLASLLLDAYIPFDPGWIETQVNDYFQRCGLDPEPFWTAALIRIMQNLGAFARFSDRPFFRDKIAPAQARLDWILPRLEIPVPAPLQCHKETT